MIDYVPADFSEVPFGTTVASACAPKVEDPRFHGILIRTPEQIRVSGGEPVIVPICGYFQLATWPLVQGAKMEVHLRGVGGSPVPPVSGQVVVDEGDNEPEVPPPFANQPKNPRDYDGVISEGWFYLDAQRYLPQSLPPGTYEVMVTYGDDRSNVTRVQIYRPR